MRHHRVRFDIPIRVARLPRDDERSVMRYLIRHIRYCTYCWISTDSQIRTQLCSRGSGYARDVLQYMYFKHGKAFSLPDWQRGHGDVQIEIPHRYISLNNLFNGYTNPSDDRPSSDRSISKKRKIYVHETGDVNRREKTKGSPSTECVDEHIEEYITVYTAIPAMTIPLKLKRADLLRDIPLQTHLD